MTIAASAIAREAPAKAFPAPAQVALVAGSVGGLVLAVLTVVLPSAGVDAATWVMAGLVAAWATAALVLALHGAHHLSAVTLGVTLVAGVGAVAAGDDGPGWLAMLSAALLPAAALHLELTVPDGRVGRVARRNAIVASYIVAVATGSTLAAMGWRPAAGVVAAAVGGAIVLGLPSAHARYRRTVGIARQRLQLLGCATTIVLEVALVVGGLRILVDWPAHAAAIAAASTGLVPMALVAGASARIARRADRVLVHTVSATGLTTVVVGVYIVVVLSLGRTPTRTERSLLVLSMLAAAFTAVVYGPARQRIAEPVNRLVYGERFPPDEVLRTWGSRLSRAIPMDELLLQLAESLRKVLVLRRAEVWTGTAERLELAVSVPDRQSAPLTIGPDERPVIARAGVTGNAWLQVWLPAIFNGRPDAQLRVAPACHSGELLGLIVVERAADDDRFDEEDDRVLAELARQVGLALHNVELDSALEASLDDLRRVNAELRASRTRVVAAGDAERRRIERDLHDGAQQHLVALAVNLRLTSDVLREDPEAAAEMLEQLSIGVKDTIEELRSLAHGIYPPLLKGAGIAEALRAAAARSPLDVAVEIGEGVGRYSIEAEAAVYFCALEAMQNAGKHAPASQVTVRVWEDEAPGSDGRWLRFEVVDDGPGFDATAASEGHGFLNMSDRLGAMGGTITWRSEPGEGAAVIGGIPLSGSAASATAPPAR